MNDVFDRLLEHVLRDELQGELRARRAAPDLEARIAAALAGRDADGIRCSLPRPVDDGRPARRRWLPLAIAVAAGLAVAATWLGSGRSGLTCSQPLLAATDVDAPFAPSTHFDASVIAWCAGDGPVAITAADGTRASVESGCAFVVDPQHRSAELLAGALELRPCRTPWRVTTDGIAVLVPADAAVRVARVPEASPQPRSMEPDMTPNDLRAHLRVSTVPALFSVLVLAGTAELATAQGREVLAAGASRTLDVGVERAADRGDERAAVARAQQLYADVRKELPPATDEASTVARKNLDDGFHELMTTMLSQPAVASSLRPAIAKDLAGGTLAAEPLARIVQLALLDGEDRIAGLARRQWAQHADAFDLEAQIALAERKFAPAMAKVREAFPQQRGRKIARLIAALAVGGDETARTALGRFLNADVAMAAQDPLVLDARCQAAVAMQALGDAEPMRALRTALATQVETWVASGEAQQLALADSCLQRGEYWLASERPRLSWADLRIAAASTQRGEPTAASLRARAKALAPK